jgi:hypothetical protein
MVQNSVSMPTWGSCMKLRFPAAWIIMLLKAAKKIHVA